MQKIKFHEFNIDRLKAEARIWSEYNPEIRAIRLYRGKARNTYLLLFHLITDTLGFIAGVRDEHGLEVFPPWSEVLDSHTDLSKTFYDACFAGREIKPEHEDFISRLKVAFFYGDRRIGLRFLNENKPNSSLQLSGEELEALKYEIFEEVRFKDHFKLNSSLQLFPEETKREIDAREMSRMMEKKAKIEQAIEASMNLVLYGRDFLENKGRPLKRQEGQDYMFKNLEPSSDQNGNLAPHMLKLSRQAYNEWLDFSRHIETELREGGRFEFIRDWAGKLPVATIRLSGLMHCVLFPQQPWKEPISVETMQQGLGLGAVFTEHAMKTFDLMGCDKNIEGARLVWRWVERGRFKTFRKRDCHNALQGRFPRVAAIEPPLDVLTERKYLAKSTEKTGGRPSDIFSVNPELTRGW